MNATQLALSWTQAAPTRCAALRKFLGDGQWHSQASLQDVGGYRYGARLKELRDGDDGGPRLLIEKRAGSTDREWFYRSVGESADGAPVTRVSPIDRIRELAARVRTLEEQVRSLGGTP